MSTTVVLITGALTGIGRAAALAFAREGNRIVVAGCHETAGQELVTELRALGTEAEFVRADVRHDDDMRNLVDRTVARFGGRNREPERFTRSVLRVCDQSPYIPKSSQKMNM